MRTHFIACRVVAAQLNSRVSDLVATQGLRKACTFDAPEVQETPCQSADVAALQQKVVDLSDELRDVRREMGGQRMPSTVPAGAHQLQSTSRCSCHVLTVCLLRTAVSVQTQLTLNSTHV